MAGRRVGLLRRFGASRSASTAIEYGLIAVMIAVVIVASVTTVGTNLRAVFQSLTGAF